MFASCPESAPLSLNIEIVNTEEPLTCFKVVGAGQSVIGFVAACNGEPSAPRKRSDWSGLYVQFGRAHAIGTVGYRWDQGYSVATMLAVTLRLPRVAIVRDVVMADGGVSGAAKAAAVRSALGLRASGLLMDDVGAAGLALACWETQDELELVIPDAMVERAVADSRVVEQFRPNRFGATAERRAFLGSDAEDGTAAWGPWVPFSECSVANEEPLVPPWFQR